MIDIIDAVVTNKNTIFVTGICPFDSMTKEHELNISPDLWIVGIDKYQTGATMQDAFPTMSPSDREFLISGFTPTEWNAIFMEDKNV